MDDAGSRAASGMSLIAKANGLDPHVWLSDVLARLPTAKARDIDQKIAEGRSQEIGRFTAIAASLIVIATAGTLLLGSLERFLR